MSRTLAKKEAQQQQLQQQHQHAREVDTQEHHASANASAGLNLNLFGALSGALSSKSKKTTHHAPDGSSMSVEERNDKAAGSGYAQGQGSAYAQGAVDDVARKQRVREVGQEQQQARQIKGAKTTDHLGIEG